MVYLKSFEFPDDDAEFDFLLNVKRKCYASFYPFKILSRRRFETLTVDTSTVRSDTDLLALIDGEIDFEPITILYGGNGSGKSTALHVIAARADVRCDARFNKTSFFEDYVKLCRMDADDIPTGSRLLASDDVFDEMLDTRAFNDGMDQRRETVFEEYLANKRSHFQLSSMADYEKLRLVNSARHKTQSRYTREELGMNVRTYSNGENAFKMFTNAIEEDALYLLDEPENSLSPQRQIELTEYIENAARFFRCQFVISTHSPFLLGLRGAKIYDLDSDPVDVRRWTELENVRVYYEFFKKHEKAFLTE